VTGGVRVPVHLAEKLVPGTPGAGEPFQVKATCGSVCVAAGVPDSVVLA
jgi:hypothetical protein